MTSLRTQLLVAMFLLLTGVALAAAAVTYFLVQAETKGFFDEQLRQVAMNVGDNAPGAVLANPEASKHDPEDDFVIDVWDGKGALLRTSAPGTAIPRGTQTGFSNVQTGGTLWRSFLLVSASRVVQVSQQSAVREEMASDSAVRSLVPILAVIPLSWLLLSLVVNRMFRRLDDLTSLLSARTPADRSLIPVDGLPSEVAPLVTAVNDLLGRLQAALNRQRRFVADAAHELRTPLSALQLQIGNLRKVASGETVNARIDELERGVRRASDLVRQLLTMAQQQETEPRKGWLPVDLSEVTRTAIAGVLPLADARGQDLGMTENEPVIVEGVAEDLRVLASNLIENAIRYSPEGGTIDIAVKAGVAGATLEVRDNGPGIPADQLERVFEPFHRVADPSVEGSGLGLSIVARIAEAHGAEVTLANRTDGPGLVARVSFPVSGGAEAAGTLSAHSGLTQRQ